MIIAIDGPAASGKGTLARRVAEHYGLHYLDTGLLYRAVGHDLAKRGIDPSDGDEALAAARRIDAGGLDDPALRSHGAAQAASRVAAIGPVRAALLDMQRAFAARPPGAVLDGRDIGTVICPRADVKLFVTASVEERARRRQREMLERGEDAAYDTILADLRQRDQRDSERAVAPLKPASDAYLLDTTNLDIEASFRAAIALIDAARTG